MANTNRTLVPLALALALTACASADDAAGQEDWKTDFTNTTVELTEIVSGGPPKDGIPAIDEPRFVSVRQANRFLDKDEPVAVVRRNGETKVYPIQILIFHEIVNDIVGGDPVTVTYCPLCNTTLAFDRHFEDQLPDAQVLSRETGFDRYTDWYGHNPYEGYDTRSGPMSWTFKGKTPEQLPRMERVVALHEGGESWAVSFSDLREEKIAVLTVGGLDVVVFFTPETVSSVDAAKIADSRAVGSSATYEPVVDGRALTFEPANESGRYRDEETGSLWNFSGVAVEGPLEGTRLTEVAHGNHFWFAWAAFRPDTKIWSRRRG